MSYRKVGGLHFVRVWRLGFAFYLTKPKPRIDWDGEEWQVRV